MMWHTVSKVFCKCYLVVFYNGTQCALFQLGEGRIAQFFYRMVLVWECSNNIKSPPSPEPQLFPFCPLYKGFPRRISAHVVSDTGDTKDRNKLTLHLLEWVGSDRHLLGDSGLAWSWSPLRGAYFSSKTEERWGDNAAVLNMLHP